MWSKVNFMKIQFYVEQTYAQVKMGILNILFQKQFKCTLVVHWRTIYNNQNMKAAKNAIDRWMDKDVHVIYDGILLSLKKEQNSVICSHMEGSRDCHTEWNKSDRDKQMSYDITYM